jgi:hypothetical protein
MLMTPLLPMHLASQLALRMIKAFELLLHKKLRTQGSMKAFDLARSGWRAWGRSRSQLDLQQSRISFIIVYQYFVKK